MPFNTVTYGKHSLKYRGPVLQLIGTLQMQDGNANENVTSKHNLISFVLLRDCFNSFYFYTNDELPRNQIGKSRVQGKIEIDHSILLHKLQHYGIRGVINNWFHSYLTDRVQSTQIKSNTSNKETVSCGVPQGSVLGPYSFSYTSTTSTNRLIN